MISVKTKYFCITIKKILRKTNLFSANPHSCHSTSSMPANYRTRQMRQSFGSFLIIWLSFIQQYSTGTTSIVSISIVIPPKEGIAIGTIISEPRPVEVRTGINARIVVAVVIRQGRILRIPAWITI